MIHMTFYIEVNELLRVSQISAGGRERAPKVFNPGSIHTIRGLFFKFFKK